MSARFKHPTIHPCLYSYAQSPLLPFFFYWLYPPENEKKEKHTSRKARCLRVRSSASKDAFSTFPSLLRFPCSLVVSQQEKNKGEWGAHACDRFEAIENFHVACTATELHGPSSRKPLRLQHPLIDLFRSSSLFHFSYRLETPFVFHFMRSFSRAVLSFVCLFVRAHAGTIHARSGSN